jgi:CTP:molybdopterin cytidylyltransferase MocA
VIAGLILAAGLGTRMGSSKPLLVLDGRTALERVLCTLGEADIGAAVVVLGHDADRVTAGVDLRGRIVVTNSRPDRGLSSSLALGIDAVPPDSEGVLVLHADMPFVRASTVRAVCALAKKGAQMAAPRWGTERGFPVYFSRVHLVPLRASLAGDEGGRRYIEAHHGLLEVVSVDDPGCVRDLDRPRDLAACEGRASWTTSV